MRATEIWHLAEVPWAIFVVYWIAGSLKTRATREKESSLSRITTVLVEIAGFVLLFSRATDVGFLGTRVIPRTILGAITGVAFTWAGIALAIWARYHLAEYWSARITIKEGHQLIRTGPYSNLRHPIYSGLILAAMGSALVIDHWRCVLGVCLAATGYCFKARKEEAMLEGQFGDAFREHRKHAGFLLPRFIEK